MTPGSWWSGGPGQPGPARPGPEEDPMVRPFMLTGGRTQPVQDGLRIETQLYAAPAATTP